MYEIDNQKFGAFLVQLRKQKGFTQKELASHLYVSDKAVSKWERGLSLPDISLLTPLAEILEVTVTELLQGHFIHQDEPMTIQQVEELMTGTLALSAKELKAKKIRKRWEHIYEICFILIALEIFLLRQLGFTWDQLYEGLLTVEILSLCLGGWFCFFIQDTLPDYYDQNKITCYTQGAFHMQLAGIRLSNKNWPHILSVGRFWLLAIGILFPLIFFVSIQLLTFDLWNKLQLFFLLPACLGFFIPMLIVAKYYE